MKKLIRIAGLAAAIGVVLWLTRERLSPAPHVSGEAAPPFRSTPPAPVPSTAGVESDDLRAIRGIGPVFANRLAESGVATFRSLADADAATIAETLGIAENRVQDWIVQARRRLG